MFIRQKVYATKFWAIYFVSVNINNSRLLTIAFFGILCPSVRSLPIIETKQSLSDIGLQVSVKEFVKICNISRTACVYISLYQMKYNRPLLHTASMCGRPNAWSIYNSLHLILYNSNTYILYSSVFVKKNFLNPHNAHMHFLSPVVNIYCFTSRMQEPISTK